MSSLDKIHAIDIPSLQIIHYPDPRLQEVATALEAIDDSVCQLADKMLELMFAAKGVGLAAPQVGIGVRLFVSSQTGQPDDQHVYINPRILSAEGWQEEEEGCLSVPGINCRVRRRAKATVEAMGLDGKVFQETAEGLGARLFQHEIDHLDGKLIVDRMGALSRLANRRALGQLEEEFQGK